MSINFHPDVNYQLQQFAPEEQRVSQETAQKPVTGQEDSSNRMPVGATEKPTDALFVDHEHHVPLVATALMDENGDAYGIAVDHRVPLQFDFQGQKHDISHLLAQHEYAELPHMQNLMDQGMSPQDAYHDAHDLIAIPSETALSKAYAVRNGLDPEAFHEAYKDHIRQYVPIAREPTDRDIHPDGHTTQYGLDVTEGGIDAAVEKKHAELLDKNPTAVLAGGSSQTSNKVNLLKAMQLETNGADPEEIFDKTGWFKGGDKRWRYEISDQGARLKTENLSINPWNKSMYFLDYKKEYKLGDILEHPELYKAYPELKDVPVKPIIGPDILSYRGGVDTEGNIHLSGSTSEEMKSVALHEIQHKIQHAEGFETGGNTKAFEHPELRNWSMELTPHENRINKGLTDLGIESNVDYMAWATKFEEKYGAKGLDKITAGELEKLKTNPGLYRDVRTYGEIKKDLSTLREQAADKYTRLSGEVEARNVQTRAKPSNIATYPWHTEDVPRDQQIFRKAVGTEMLQGGQGHRIPTLEELMDRPLDE